MMGGRGLIPCKFGVQCHRQDCWYAHPDGRIVDVGGLAGSGALARGGMVRPAHAHPVFGVAEVPSGLMPRMDAGSGCGSGSGACLTGGNECRYSFDCKRVDCHFKHPFGRAIDVDGVGGSMGSPFRRPGLQRAPSNSSICSLTRGMSEVSFGSYAPSDATDEDQALRDTWFPQARGCSCCKGYMYGCTAEICEAMGMCTCGIEETDLDSSGLSMQDTRRLCGTSVNLLPSGTHVCQTSWYQPLIFAYRETHGVAHEPGVGVGMPLAPNARVNGSCTAHAMGLKEPPQPPTEAALAALGSYTLARAAPPAPLGIGERANSNVSGGGRRGEAYGKNGPGDSRFGAASSRTDNSYRHPQGREADTVRVSFGDFDVLHTSAVSDARGSGNGNGSVHTRVRTVDQDLMDTWYPDCRHCPCCKGFKHGCQTAACAEAGICACVSRPPGGNGVAVGVGSHGPSPQATEASETAEVAREDSAVTAKPLAPKEGTEVTKAAQTESAAREVVEAPVEGCCGEDGSGGDVPADPVGTEGEGATAVSTKAVVGVEAAEADESAFRGSNGVENGGDGAASTSTSTTSTALTVSEDAGISA